MTRRNLIRIIGKGAFLSLLKSSIPSGKVFSFEKDLPIPNYFLSPIGYPLPSWFNINRVHAHTRMTLQNESSPMFYNLASEFKKIGVKVFVRSFKIGGEGAWWHSKEGTVAPEARTKNVAKTIIDEAHNEGMKVIAYYRHMEDRYMQKLHPDWTSVDWENKPIGKERGNYLCFNSPYKDFVKQRLIELTRFGADGFYFDDKHMSPAGCWCQYCQDAFKKSTGNEHPLKEDIKDPLWHKLIDFNNTVIENAFREWQEGVKKINGEAVILISGFHFPGMTDRHLTGKLFDYCDAMKSEFSMPLRVPPTALYAAKSDVDLLDKNIKLALGYSIARDTAGGNPAHTWIPGLTDEASSLYATAGVLTNGCIANIDMAEEKIPDFKFESSFKLGNKLSPYFADVVPLRWAGIHYSEMVRNTYEMMPDEVLRQVINPLYEIFSNLFSQRVPVGIITDNLVEEDRINNYKILFIPNADKLNVELKNMLEDFKKQEGKIIEYYNEYKTNAPDIKKAFKKFSSDYLYSAPIQIIGGAGKMQVGYFINKNEDKLLVLLCNEFAEVETGRKLKKKIFVPPLPCSPSQCIVRGYKVKRAYDILNEKELGIENKPKGEFTIDIPQFEYLQAVQIELKK